jgi:cardiolipin synthase A/B
MIESILWWLVIIFLIVSLSIFVGFYLRGAFRDRITYKVKHAPRPEEPQFPYTLASITNSFITNGIITDFWHEAAAIQRARLDAISKAQHTIDFEKGFAQSHIITYAKWQQRSLIKHRILGNLVDFFQWQL